MPDNPLTLLLHSDPASRPAHDVLEDLGVSRKGGLEPAEARQRLQRYGPNAVQARSGRRWPAMLLDQLGSPAAALLAGAAILSFGFGQDAGGLAFAAALVLRAVIGFSTDLAAERSMEDFHRLRQTKSRVRRGGEVHEVAAEDLVLGDIVLLEAGEEVTADLRLLSASRLRADESALTGASDPVDKDPDPKWPGAPLEERTSMVFGGTQITCGSGEGVVVGTGAETELNRTRGAARPLHEQTSLRERLVRLGRRLTRTALLAAILVAALALLAGEGLLLTVQLSVALFVAAVPENLAAGATLSLGRGLLRLLHGGIGVNRPDAVEALASTDLLWIEEAGVLTEGRMSAVRAYLESGETSIGAHGPALGEDRVLHELLEIGLLCNDASVEEGGSAVEPTEAALLETAAAMELDREALIRSAPTVRTVLAPANTKATYHKVGEDVYLVAVKGSPARVMDACTRVRTAGGEEFIRGSEREWWDGRNEQLAADGLRVLAIAAKEADSGDEEPFEDLTLLGLVGFEDPIRADTAEAVDHCRKRGVRVVAASEDQTETARSIARAAGLVEDAGDVVHGKEFPPFEDIGEDGRRRVDEANVFVDLDPEQTERVISAYRREGFMVTAAGTGRDAAALETSDTGIMVGERGSLADRGLADFVLADSSFSAISAAIWQARGIFASMSRYLTYRISCGAALVLTVAVALIAGLPLPVLPLQILLLSLLTHVFPALALGAGIRVTGPSASGPRKPGPFHAGWPGIAGYAGLVTASALAAFTLALLWSAVPGGQVVAISFLTLAFAQLWLVPSLRTSRAWIEDDVVRNPYIWAALLLCAILLAGVVYAPGLSTLLELEPLGLAGWALVLGLSPLPLLIGEVYRRVRRAAV
jgi:Ca2+-transporting ATPase